MTSLVTGAAGSIGSAVVALLAQAGERVIAQDLRPPATPPGGRDVTWVTGDLLTPAGRDAVREALEDGGLTCVIAAHGVDGAAPLREVTEAFAQRVVEVNFTSVHVLLELTLPALRATGGRFVAISSQAGLIGEPDNAAYSAAKFALVGWARVMAPELAREGVGMHVLCPGCTESPLLYHAQERFARATGAVTDEQVRAFVDARAARIPVGRFAPATETAATAVYLGTGPGPRPVVLAETGGEVPW